MGPSKGDTIVWYRVTRHPQIFRGLTVSQRTLEFWGVTVAAGDGKIMVEDDLTKAQDALAAVVEDGHRLEAEVARLEVEQTSFLLKL